MAPATPMKAATPKKATPMKAKAAKGAKAMSKGKLGEALSKDTGFKKSQILKMLSGLASVVAAQVKSVGQLVIPGVIKIKTRTRPASKGGKKSIFGKVVTVKAKPAKTVVKATPVAALKKTV